MPQGQDALRKVARGGAGNFHAASAQRQPSPTDEEIDQSVRDVVALAPPDAPGPLRGGRGGAGNFVDPADAPYPGEAVRDMDAVMLAASRARKQRGRERGMGGRGGAGNWAGRPVLNDGGDEDEDDGGGEVWIEIQGPHAQKVEALERKVKEVVDKGLRMPDKVHHGKDKGGYE